jgi:hypothetical protein
MLLTFWKYKAVCVKTYELLFFVHVIFFKTFLCIIINNGIISKIIIISKMV